MKKLFLKVISDFGQTLRVMEMSWILLLVSSYGFCAEEVAFLKMPANAREVSLGSTTNSFALSMINFGVSDLQKKNEDSELEGTFSVQDYSFGLSYAREGKTISDEGNTLKLPFSYGITLKYLHENIENTIAHEVCISAGLLYKTPDEIRGKVPVIPNYFSSAVTNLGQRLQEEASPIETRHSFSPPMKAKAGFAYELYFTPMGISVVSTDISASLTSGYHGLSVGVERGVNRIFLLRLRVEHKLRDIEDLGLPTMMNFGVGCGFKVDNFLIDYVYSIRDLQNTQALSIGLEFSPFLNA